MSASRSEPLGALAEAHQIHGGFVVAALIGCGTAGEQLEDNAEQQATDEGAGERSAAMASTRARCARRTPKLLSALLSGRQGIRSMARGPGTGRISLVRQV
jgi:hypothetical protein